MNKNKTYDGNLYIDKNKISIETDYKYQGLEIDYKGDFSITKLLPENYIISKANNKIVIVKLIKDDNNILDLFTYKGSILISQCLLVTEDLKSYYLDVNKISIETLSELNGTWETNTRNYEDMDFDGNNNKKPYLYRKLNYNEDSREYSTIKEIRNK